MSVTVRAVPCLLCFFDIFVYESKRVDVVKVSDDSFILAIGQSGVKRAATGPAGATADTR